jgi:hypothetical protein
VRPRIFQSTQNSVMPGTPVDRHASLALTSYFPWAVVKAGWVGYSNGHVIPLSWDVEAQQ